MKFQGPTPTLRTKRLLLRPLTIDDCPFIQSCFERFEVVRYMSDAVPWPYPKDGAVSFFRNVLGPAIAGGEERAWAITLNGEMIGAINVRTSNVDARGFWLAPEHWGQGYMREAADRVTEYVLVELGWPGLVAGNAVANEASSRIKRSQGFELKNLYARKFVSGIHDYEKWYVSRKTWMEKNPRLS